AAPNASCSAGRPRDERLARRRHRPARAARVTWTRRVGRARACRGGSMTTAHLGRVRATAFATLTLSLNVVGRRDDGFHDLEALAVPIGQPHAPLEAVAVRDPAGVTLDVVSGDRDVPTGHENLALRGAEALLLHAGRAGHGVQLALRKRIPPARGLGGGSA